jgi:5-methylcytosine-specific restriction endonuclease McrA
MRKLKEPDYNAADVFSTCISKVSDSELKKRYLDCIPDIINASQTYKELARNASLYTFQDNLCKNRRVDINEMKAIYTQRMAHRQGPGYDIYKKLKKVAAYRTCPICGHRKVTTLDHYLPKALYPSVVVAPLNLIPSCFECNKQKSSKTSKSSEKETLHPYFDDLGNERFLFAEVIETEPPVINFRIVAPPSWSEQLTERVKHHFDTFRLNILYRIHAADEILGQIEYWSPLNKDSLRKHLLDQASSRSKVHINSWETALYEGIATSEWFCEGGYLKLEEPED